jgi:hypothetical protein
VASVAVAVEEETSAAGEEEDSTDQGPLAGEVENQEEPKEKMPNRRMIQHSAPRKGGRPFVPCFAFLVHLRSGFHAGVVTAVAAVAAGRGIGDGTRWLPTTREMKRRQVPARAHAIEFESMSMFTELLYMYA